MLFDSVLSKLFFIIQSSFGMFKRKPSFKTQSDGIELSGIYMYSLNPTKNFPISSYKDCKLA